MDKTTACMRRALGSAALALCFAPAAILAGDAYVELDGTQVINTGYRMKMSSRIVSPI